MLTCWSLPSAMSSRFCHPPYGEHMPAWMSMIPPPWHRSARDGGGAVPIKPRCDTQSCSTADRARNTEITQMRGPTCAPPATGGPCNKREGRGWHEMMRVYPMGACAARLVKRRAQPCPLARLQLTAHPTLPSRHLCAATSSHCLARVV